MLLLRPPGVYRAQGDTQLLTDVLLRDSHAEDRHVLDIGTGTGALALAAARSGALSVTAVDLSLRSVGAAWINSRLRGLGVTVLRGDLFAPVSGRRFGLILANPPYVPALDDHLPRHSMGRCWDAGTDGRVLLDRICAEAPGLLSDDGTLLVTHSALCGVHETIERLRDSGLDASVVAHSSQPFGPVLRSRARMLEQRGLIEVGQRRERLVVIAASRAKESQRAA